MIAVVEFIESVRAAGVVDHGEGGVHGDAGQKLAGNLNSDPVDGKNSNCIRDFAIREAFQRCLGLRFEKVG